jgi:hypothetical protein
MSLKEAADRVVAVAANPDAPYDEIILWAKDLFTAVREAPRDDIEEALQALAQGIALPAGDRAAFLATCCGALVEQGTDPAPMVAPMLTRLDRTVRAAHAFHRACVADIPPDADRGEAFQQSVEKLTPRMPDGAAAFRLLDQIYAPAVALFSASPDARARARSLLDPLEAMERDQEGAHWLTRMLKVLHGEPYLAIELPTGRGIVGRMTGVVENFQLNVLLMDAFPRAAGAKRRVSEDAARIARGQGPQRSGESITGVWNLHTWRALRPADATLPDPKDQFDSAHWIWNEGLPVDIPTFEGHRVILLGPPSYSRGWGSQRAFASLPADLSVERELTKNEVNQWLARIAAANARNTEDT